MKKLGKLKLNNFTSLSREEQKSIIGGDWVYDYELGEWVYELDEVTVYGSEECPACKAGREGIKEIYGPLGDTWAYTFLGFQHILGCKGHR
jgi:natural product precursor